MSLCEKKYPTLHRILAGISPTLYHRTNDAAGILKTNEFHLTFAQSADDVGKNKEKWFYLSCTRTPLGSFWSAATLKLDGRKLAQHYSGGPVDYWGPEFRKVQKDKREFEDRVWSHERVIPEAKSYILEVHVAAKHQGGTDQGTKERLRAIAIACKTAGIPVYFYDDTKAYNLLQKNKAITPDFATTIRDAWPPYNKGRKRRHYLSNLIELYWGNEAKLKQSAKEVRKNGFQDGGGLYHAYRNITGIDQGAGVKADIHNEKNKPIIESLAKVLRDGKFKSIDELLAFIREKYKDVDFR